MFPQPKQLAPLAVSVPQGDTSQSKSPPHYPNQPVIKGGNLYFYNEQPPSQEEHQTTTQINVLSKFPEPSMPVSKLHTLLTLSQMGFLDVITQH